MCDLLQFLIVLVVLAVLRIAVIGLDAITKAENKKDARGSNSERTRS